MADKTKSEIWEFFSKCEDGTKTECKLCHKKLAYSKGSTKSMWNHIKSIHSSAKTSSGVSIKSEYGLRQQNITDFAREDKFTQKKLQNCYLRAADVCACDLRPFSMFKMPAFEAFMREVQPKFTTPSHPTVKKYLQIRYQEEKDVLRSLLLSCEAGIGVTADIWTSCNKQTRGLIHMLSSFNTRERVGE